MNLKPGKQQIGNTVIHELAPLGSPGLSKMIFAELRKCSATGHVGRLRLIHGEEEQWLIKEDVRAVWEISENVEIFTFDQLEEDHLFGGVSAKDTNVTWEEAYELLKMICQIIFLVVLEKACRAKDLDMKNSLFYSEI